MWAVLILALFATGGWCAFGLYMRSHGLSQAKVRSLTIENRRLRGEARQKEYLLTKEKAAHELLKARWVELPDGAQRAATSAQASRQVAVAIAARARN